MTKPIKKTVPRLKTDRQAEAFLAQDLSNLDFSQFKPAQFKFEKKKLKQVNSRVRKSKSGRSERS
jgi:predicted DNA binding CopG/RHH family protein